MSLFRQPPFALELTRESVGQVYSIRVIARDFYDNEATCSYSIIVGGTYARAHAHTHAHTHTQE